jgi:hypothetical protein
MKLTLAQIKRRYFNKVYAAAPTEPCACGCGQLIKTKDKYGRDRKYISGHNGRKYEDPTEYKRAWNHANRPQRRTYARTRVHKLKEALIHAAGGKCECCGLPFTGCSALFDFHHRDPSQKEFSLNNRTLNAYGIVRIRNEAKKCSLLCANCHRMVHWNW